MEIEGKFSGEVFRKEYLYPKLRACIENDSKLVIVLDGTAGYGTSFLEEAFGGLIRHNNLTHAEIMSHISVVSEEQPYLVDDINDYLADAEITED